MICLEKRESQKERWGPAHDRPASGEAARSASSSKMSSGPSTAARCRPIFRNLGFATSASDGPFFGPRAMRHGPGPGAAWNPMSPTTMPSSRSTIALQARIGLQLLQPHLQRITANFPVRRPPDTDQSSGVPMLLRQQRPEDRRRLRDQIKAGGVDGGGHCLEPGHLFNSAPTQT